MCFQRFKCTGREAPTYTRQLKKRKPQMSKAAASKPHFRAPLLSPAFALGDPGCTSGCRDGGPSFPPSVDSSEKKGKPMPLAWVPKSGPLVTSISLHQLTLFYFQPRPDIWLKFCMWQNILYHNKMYTYIICIMLPAQLCFSKTSNYFWEVQISLFLYQSASNAEYSKLFVWIRCWYNSCFVHAFYLLCAFSLLL